MKDEQTLTNIILHWKLASCEPIVFHLGSELHTQEPSALPYPQAIHGQESHYGTQTRHGEPSAQIKEDFLQ